MSKMAPRTARTPSAKIELVRRLGAGGMGEVWLAHRKGARAETQVAIKLMAPHLCHSPEHLRLFESEARLSMLLNHSNIVQVFDLCRVGERLGLVMEWVDGVTLEQLLRWMRRAGTLPPPDVTAYILGELLKALIYAHGEGDRAVVHRDISPHNVLLSVSGQVKLADFGVARLSSEASSEAHVRGKLRYMAPEQASGASSKPAFDLYSLGAVFHELLAGEQFRKDVARDSLFTVALAGEIPQLRRADVPLALARIREELLQPRASNRVPTASGALHKLRKWPEYRNVGHKLARLVQEANEGIQNSTADIVTQGYQVPTQGCHRSIFPRVALAWLTSLGIGAGLAQVGQQPAFYTNMGRDAVAQTQESVNTSRGEHARVNDPNAAITFVAADSASLEIMVADQVIRVDPTARVQLPSGLHRIQMWDAHNGWQLVGELDIQSGRQYEVELVEPLGGVISGT